MSLRALFSIGAERGVASFAPSLPCIAGQPRGQVDLPSTECGTALGTGKINLDKTEVTRCRFEKPSTPPNTTPWRTPCIILMRSSHTEHVKCSKSCEGKSIPPTRRWQIRVSALYIRTLFIDSHHRSKV